MTIYDVVASDGSRLLWLWLYLRIEGMRRRFSKGSEDSLLIVIWMCCVCGVAAGYCSRGCRSVIRARTSKANESSLLIAFRCVAYAEWQPVAMAVAVSAC